ncbi:MAG TPA: ABC transporter substrate-binding protein [Anaerolineales bacterium]|nr:ABC transporter substrate-binding protein [Anaerolineales bacterium]
MKNKKITLFVVLLIMGILLVACGGGTPPAEETQIVDATQAPVEATATIQPVSTVDLKLDPANLASDNAKAAVPYLYEGLVRLQDGAVVGALASTFTVSEDGLDYIFDLRTGVTFHDGTLLNADTVVLNFNRWFDPADANRGSGEYAAWVANFGGFKGELTEDGKPKSPVDGIEKQDEFTVIIHLNTPDPDLLTKLTDPAFSIMSASSFAGNDGGTGPYKAASNDGTTITLEPFAGYWDPAAIPSANVEIPAP